MTPDEAFKKLITALPAAALEAFAADLAAAWGPPQTATVEASELLPHIPGQTRSRFLDVAIRFTWADGQERIILLVEHWSQASKLDLRRALIYTAELLHHHPDCPVLPVMVVADGTAADRIPDRLAITVHELPILDFRVTVIAVHRDVLPRWTESGNPVLAVLAALLRDLPPVAVALRAAQLLRRAQRDIWVLETTLHLIDVFARLNEAQQRQFHHQLRQEVVMGTVVDLIRAEGKAEGLAAGMERLVAAILALVQDGDLAADRARQRLHHLHAEGLLSAAGLAAALARL